MDAVCQCVDVCGVCGVWCVDILPCLQCIALTSDLKMTFLYNLKEVFDNIAIYRVHF